MENIILYWRSPTTNFKINDSLPQDKQTQNKTYDSIKFTTLRPLPYVRIE